MLGSTGCQPVVGGSLPPTLIRVNGYRCVRQAAERGRLAACAPRKERRRFSCAAYLWPVALTEKSRTTQKLLCSRHLVSSFTSQTPSFDSSSPSRSRTFSSGAVGKFFPT